MLDTLYAAGVTEVFLEVAREARQAFPIPVRALHADATSFHVHGRCEGLGEEMGAIRVTYGYSRDHRPDLKQWVMNLVCADTGGIPLLFAPGDGNQSDREALVPLLARYRQALDLGAVVVLDGAGYSRENLRALEGFSRIRKRASGGGWRGRRGRRPSRWATASWPAWRWTRGSWSGRGGAYWGHSDITSWSEGGAECGYQIADLPAAQEVGGGELRPRVAVYRIPLTSDGAVRISAVSSELELSARLRLVLLDEKGVVQAVSVARNWFAARQELTSLALRPQITTDPGFRLNFRGQAGQVFYLNGGKLRLERGPGHPLRRCLHP
ncbi:mobile element protein [Thermus aquaticus Y51MC23]|uniref:Mobile element protein n=1 Tax=Thermus aquaticus (strain ATCC BAA-2747 / Y51MC23) TaxID=498848 RepID=A0ABN4IGC5_THEA5|nr:mobile element protein [Thermus aquaticus Y51MC23]